MTAHDLQDAAVTRAAVDSSSRALVEGAMFAGTALAVVCPLARVDVVVTDGNAPDDALGWLRAARVRVVPS